MFFFKEYGVYYFNDSPEIAQKIAEKEYKYDDIEKVVNLYNTKREKKAEPKAESKVEPKAAKAKTGQKATSKPKTVKKK